MKTIIAIFGRGRWGKSCAIRTLAQNFPFESEILQLWCGEDIFRIGRYGGKIVGFVSQGDPNSIQKEWLEECVQNGCDVIVSACRSRGGTVDNIIGFAEKNGYESIFTTNYHHHGNPVLPNGVDLNVVFTGNMTTLIDNLIK